MCFILLPDSSLLSLVNLQGSLHCKQGSLWKASLYNFLWHMKQNLQIYVCTWKIKPLSYYRNERHRSAKPSVPSSACDCTCVLTRIDHCLVTLSCLPCACLCKVCSRISDTLSQALCNLSLAYSWFHIVYIYVYINIYVYVDIHTSLQELLS